MATTGRPSGSPATTSPTASSPATDRCACTPALYFARWARRVSVVVRGEALPDTLSRYLLDRIETAPNVDVITRTQVTAVSGDDWLRTVTLTGADGASEEREVQALFVCIGGVPQTAWATGHGVAADAVGYLFTGGRPARPSASSPPWGRGRWWSRPRRTA